MPDKKNIAYFLSFTVFPREHFMQKKCNEQASESCQQIIYAKDQISLSESNLPVSINTKETLGVTMELIN